MLRCFSALLRSLRFMLVGTLSTSSSNQRLPYHSRYRSKESDAIRFVRRFAPSNRLPYFSHGQ
ncbi:hypothetical protein, partial [Veillonella seminalis]|uniref:hypothetical protein n=1 Tax=Veillonella seminalis TaxID=1502943 RepID=UPI001980C053